MLDLLQIARTNFVVMNVLARGHQKEVKRQPEFDIIWTYFLYILTSMQRSSHFRLNDTRIFLTLLAPIESNKFLKVYFLNFFHRLKKKSLKPIVSQNKTNSNCNNTKKNLFAYI